MVFGHVAVKALNLSSKWNCIADIYINKSPMAALPTSLGLPAVALVVGRVGHELLPMESYERWRVGQQ